MNIPPPPLGLIAGIWKWILDLGAMPGRVRLLADGLVAERDPRPICRSCGEGRVAIKSRRPERDGDLYFGTCGHCGLRWRITPDGAALTSPDFGG